MPSPRHLAVALFPIAAACGPAASPGGPASPAQPPPSSGSASIPPNIVADATRGVTSPVLADLLARQWDWQLREGPVWATKYGDHRFDDRISDNSAEHIEEERRVEEAFLAEARAIPELASESDRTTLALLVDAMETDLASRVCAFETWAVGTYSDNPVSTWSSLPDSHPVKTAADAEHLLARYALIPRSVDESVKNLRRGAGAGRFSSAESTRRVIAMVDKQLAAAVDTWDLYEPARAEHKDWPAAALAAFRAGVKSSLESGIRPAMVRYRDYLEKESLPKARPDDKVGVRFVPGGAECYKTQIRAHTTLPLTAEELHKLGMEEVTRIDEEIVRLGEKLFGLRDLPAILARLRGDPELYFKTDVEVEQKAQSALAAAKAKIPGYFNVLPRTDCVVHRIPEVEAPFTTVAYYREPNPDGGKPGEYMINVYAPTTRPRYEAEVLAYHESIPGHHLQIALAQELPAAPAFRRFLSPTAYVEGWALYTERLADEMGLYHGDLDRMGMLSFDAWRASRLVVDTGIHDKGWSREEAVKFMLSHTALAENNIRNEVDRYIFWPGQALGYKVGQLRIWKLRRKAEEALGPAFDLKGFHDAVLGGGAVTLPVLERRIDAFIAVRKGAAAR